MGGEEVKSQGNRAFYLRLTGAQLDLIENAMETWEPMLFGLTSDEKERAEIVAQKCRLSRDAALSQPASV
jgi:hypothetical protein